MKLYATQDEANADLAAGRLDAVEADKIVLSEWLKKPEGACCEMKFDVDKEANRKIFGDGVGIAVRPEDKDLVEIVQQGDRRGRRRRHLQEDQRQVFRVLDLLRAGSGPAAPVPLRGEARPRVQDGGPGGSMA